MSESFARLSEAAADDPLWEGHALALGAEDGRSELNVTHQSTLVSLRRPGASPVPKLERGLGIARRETVEVRRLDGLLEELGAAESRIFLKVDTQGNDLDVVRGAAGLLDRVVGLQVELAIRPMYKAVPSYVEVLAELRQLGFSPSGIYPVMYDEGIALVEADCLLVRPAEACG